MCLYYYCSSPSQLIAAMLRRMFLDNTYQKSQEFSSLQDMLVVSIGFDKSDSDFVGTMRPCNWKKGNAAVYVQCVCCLEGPVAENYENKIKTVGNMDFPVKAQYKVWLMTHCLHWFCCPRLPE